LKKLKAANMLEAGGSANNASSHVSAGMTALHGDMNIVNYDVTSINSFESVTDDGTLNSGCEGNFTRNTCQDGQLDVNLTALQKEGKKRTALRW